jgi:rhodanese-related sulfurtransferase
LYARGHLRGSINIGLDGQFASWAGTILDQEKPIVLIAEPGNAEGPGRATEAALRLGRIGFDGVQGYLDGGMEALAERDDLLSRTERRSAREIYAETAGHRGGDGMGRAAAGAAEPATATMIDVRSPREYAGKHIADAMNIPLSRLREQLDSIPRERPVILHCAGGYRSSIAASLLARHGVTQVTEMAGGLAAWEAEELPVATEEGRE